MREAASAEAARAAVVAAVRFAVAVARRRLIAGVGSAVSATVVGAEPAFAFAALRCRGRGRAGDVAIEAVVGGVWAISVVWDANVVRIRKGGEALRKTGNSITPVGGAGVEESTSMASALEDASAAAGIVTVEAAGCATVVGPCGAQEDEEQEVGEVETGQRAPRDASTTSGQRCAELPRLRTCFALPLPWPGHGACGSSRPPRANLCRSRSSAAAVCAETRVVAVVLSVGVETAAAKAPGVPVAAILRHTTARSCLPWWCPRQRGAQNWGQRERQCRQAQRGRSCRRG